MTISIVTLYLAIDLLSQATSQQPAVKSAVEYNDSIPLQYLHLELLTYSIPNYPFGLLFLPRPIQDGLMLPQTSFVFQKPALASYQSLAINMPGTILSQLGTSTKPSN